MEPTVRYVQTTDDVSIAYWTYGAGPVLVVTPLVPYSHIEMEWQNLHIRQWYQRLGEFVTVVRYDGRGTGLSQRDVDDVTLEAAVLDLDAIVESFAPERIALMGVFHCGPPAMVFTARNADRVSHLILWCTYASGDDYWRSNRSEGLQALRKTDYSLFLRTAAHELFGWADDEDADRYADLMRLAVSAETADRLIAETRNYDASDILGQISCPTLVVHRRDLDWLDIGLSRSVASRIHGTHLAVVDGRSPLPPAGDTDDSTRAVARFLDLDVPEDQPEASQSDFRVVLFTDLVDHTSMMSSLGDDRGRQALREHEAITRDALRDDGGTEVKTLGDGFMASFTRITDALACAAALQKSFAHRNANLQRSSEPHLNVRIGINAGEPIAEDDDLFGATVILASRIASVAQGGEILASNAVRELSAGNEFVFRDRGTVPMKGFDEDARVWEVEWRT